MSTPPDSAPRRDRNRSLRIAVTFAVVPAIALVAVLATSAIKGSSDTTSASASPQAHAIVIKNFSFVPPTLTVPKGTKLKVTNEDGATHTLTADDGSFDTGDLSGGKTTVLTLDTTGTFQYHCKIHQYMTGKLVVR